MFSSSPFPKLMIRIWDIYQYLKIPELLTLWSKVTKQAVFYSYFQFLWTLLLFLVLEMHRVLLLFSLLLLFHHETDWNTWFSKVSSYVLSSHSHSNLLFPLSQTHFNYICRELLAWKVAGCHLWTASWEYGMLMWAAFGIIYFYTNTWAGFANFICIDAHFFWNCQVGLPLNTALLS